MASGPCIDVVCGGFAALTEAEQQKILRTNFGAGYVPPAPKKKPAEAEEKESSDDSAATEGKPENER